jgi:hypothetical protein
VVQQWLPAAAASLQDDLAYIFGGWDSQMAGTGGVILQDISSYNANKNDIWKTSLARNLEKLMSRLAVVRIDDNAMLLQNHWCINHVLVFDAHKVWKQATTGMPPSTWGLHATPSIYTLN